jgi:hypothetical protein
MRSLLLLACLPAFACAETPLEARIDSHIDAKLKSDGHVPAPQLPDTTILRRTTLDLVGRIPTLAELNEYLQSQDSNKRAKMVDRLMASPAFARYQAYLFDAMLNEGNPKGRKGGGSGSLSEYLVMAMQENRPWDRMFRELMLPDDADPKLKGASDFLRPKLADADRMANDVSVAFFGVNVSCAQCHDHPLVKDWTQEHFYGMKSFLARTYDAGGFIAEREAGLVKYKPNKGPERSAKLMFLTGTTIDSDTLRDLNKDEAKKDKDVSEKAKAEKKAPPAPKFSARAELVRLALQPKEAEFFSKSIVNRLWHRFLGYGLVNPLDQMHSENAASHPELLNELAKDMAANKYDLRRMIRGIVLSKAYSRGSKYDSEAQPPAASFAVARLKPLTPMQMATSLKIATTDPKQWEGLKPEEFEKRIEQTESSARGFASMIAMPGENFQIGVGEALLFSNGDRVLKEFFTDGGNSLLARMKAEKENGIELMMRTALGRMPTAEEAKALAQFAESRKERADEARRQMLWAVCTGPEFRFNH